MEYAKLQDKCRGSLVGGAVGDALGYEVEFMSLASIIKRFGEKGITRYVTHNGIAEFSDDTQMTLFTAEGLMNGIIDTKAGKPDEILPYIEKAYLAWYKTQTEQPSFIDGSWLSNINTLWSRRAPGNTCMGALENISLRNEFKNNSKGCGGVMRVAPIGIFNAAHPHIYKYEDTAHLAGWAAEITHHNIASTFASALMATTVENCIQDEKVDRTIFGWIVDGGLSLMNQYFPGHEDELREFITLMKRAMELGKSEVPERDAIRELGEGWVGDEALAIAVFSVMRYVDNFEDCIVCAVNHDGDSDSTGAIAGNIIGAILGYSAIPKHYIENLEIEPVLVSITDDLCADVRIREVNLRVGDRYVKHLPVEVESKYLINSSN
ncbi:MAG: ADP-ribosylglycohydrolase family protein [Muribaculum sp.]|nr:ADP-ribosylglycohydrolase family protein [Muribaculum sp.]